jgi:hypothetical protein
MLVFVGGSAAASPAMFLTDCCQCSSSGVEQFAHGGSTLTGQSQTTTKTIVRQAQRGGDRHRWRVSRPAMRHVSLDCSARWPRGADAAARF